MVTSLIRFTQGPNTDVAGNAVFGTLTDGVVVCTSAGVGATSWLWKMIDVAAGSAIPLGTFGTSSTASFPQPDARGGYLVELTTSDGTNTAVSRLAFVVKEASGRWIAPAQATDQALTFGGNLRGWAPSMEEWLRYVDTIPFPGMTISGFSPVVPVVETGSVIASPAFVASYVLGPPTTLLLTNSADGESKNVASTPNAFSSSHSFPTATPGQQFTFHLNATKPPGPTPPTANAVITTGQRVYAGVVVAGSSPATLIAAASFNQLGTSKPASITGFTGTGGTSRGQWIWPVRYGASPIVKDAATGFGVAYAVIGTFTQTNAFGFAESYYQFETISSFTGSLGLAVF